MRKITVFINLLVIISGVFLLFACGGGNLSKQSAAESANTSSAPSVSSEIIVSAPEADAAEPAVTVGSDGSLYIVWVEHGTGKSADIYLQKFDAEAKPAGEKTRVNPQAGQATAWRGDPPTIALGADGAIYVGWTASVKTDAGNGTDLYISVSRDGGKSFAAPAKVNDDTAPASHGMHSLAVDKSGKIHVAWLDERNVKMPAHSQNKTDIPAVENGFQFVRIHDSPEHKEKQTPKPETKQPAQHAAEANSEIFYAVSADGGKTFSPNKRIAAEICPCCKTSIASAPDGKIYVGWRQVLPGDFRHIAVATSGDGGRSFSAPVIVSDDKWELYACPVSGPTLAVGADNALEVSWFSAGQAGAAGLYRAASNDGGRTFSPRALVSEGMISGTPAAAANPAGGFVKVWEAGGKLFRLKRDSDAAPKVEQLGDGALPSVAVSGGKSFVGFIQRNGEKRGVRLTVIDGL